MTAFPPGSTVTDLQAAAALRGACDLIGAILGGDQAALGTARAAAGPDVATALAGMVLGCLDKLGADPGTWLAAARHGTCNTRV